MELGQFFRRSRLEPTRKTWPYAISDISIGPPARPQLRAQECVLNCSVLDTGLAEWPILAAYRPYEIRPHLGPFEVSVAGYGDIAGSSSFYRKVLLMSSLGCYYRAHRSEDPEEGVYERRSIPASDCFTARNMRAMSPYSKDPSTKFPKLLNVCRLRIFARQRGFLRTWESGNNILDAAALFFLTPPRDTMKNLNPSHPTRCSAGIFEACTVYSTPDTFASRCTLSIGRILLEGAPARLMSTASRRIRDSENSRLPCTDEWARYRIGGGRN